MALPVRIRPFDLEYDDIAIFSSNLRSELTVDDLGKAKRLFPNAVPSRHIEFTAGRACAAAALQALGGAGEVRIAHPHRYPLFPASFVGSISHTKSEAVACVGRAAAFRSVGIDIEPINPHEDLASFASAIMTDNELSTFSDMNTLEGQEFFHLCFSLKEALFKAQYPLTHAWLDFKEAEVTYLSEQNRPSVRLVGARASVLFGSGAAISCESKVHGRNIFTMVLIRR